MQQLKRVEAVYESPPTHWVGDGFPVSSVVSPRTFENRLSPFVLLDYAGPATFEPSEHPRGVDSHPHRGFETVTIIYGGELAHRDSAGNHGRIGPGDVQWMTAGAGVLHEERHSADFTQRGGVLEMAQLWVNLPARHKMDPPRYQELLRETIRSIELPDGGGTVRVIAGEFGDTPGAAQTVTPVILWDVHLRKDVSVRLPVSAGFTVGVFVRSGSVRLGDTHTAFSRQLALFRAEGADIALVGHDDCDLIILGGEPIDEPVIAHGPFVMNTPDEIHQAITDFREGRFGTL